MNARERVRSIIACGVPDRCGFWLGNPHPDTLPGYHAYFGTTSLEQLHLKLGSDLRWVTPEWTAYKHPQHTALFDMGFHHTHHAGFGPLAECETLADLDAYAWPQLEYLDFSDTLQELAQVGDFYRASGFWTSFYHVVMELFGMEAYMLKMITNPKIVQAVTERVCAFYYQANERFFAAAGELMDGFFFGNDFGTQVDLICSPKHFDIFILPWVQQFTHQAHQHGYQVILHSCGAIYKVIERLIDAGVECLHPIQANARNMDALTLAKAFKGRVAFMGGIDTQQLLVHASPAEVKAEVRRVRDHLGPNLIVSPSHEALLPDTPPQNVEAMAQAVLE